MLDTRRNDQRNKTFSRVTIAPALEQHMRAGGKISEWIGDMTPVASLARISEDRLDGDAIGVNRQHKNNTRNAIAAGCIVVLHYEDNNITAAKRTIKRPAFLEMIDHLINGREPETGIPLKGCIAVEKARVYRLARDFVLFQDALTANDGIFVVGQKIHDIVNDEGAYISGLVTAGTGEGEVKKIRERSRRNHGDKAREGAVMTGRRRFGYLPSGDGHKVNERKNPAEWPHLVKAIKDLSEGMPLRSAVRELNSKNIPTTQGKKWSASGLKMLVTNPAWWGGRIWEGELITAPESDQPLIGRWEHATPEADGIGYETWKQLMTRFTSPKLNRPQEIAAREKRALQPPYTKYLFSSFLRCGRINRHGEICYQAISGQRNHHHARNPKQPVFIYRCTSPDCRGVGRNGPAIDRYLEGLVVAYMDKHFSNTRAEFLPWHGEDHLQLLKKQRRDIKHSLVSGEVSWSSVHSILLDLDARIKKLESEERAHVVQEQANNIMRGWSHERWARMATSEKREIVNQLFASVVVHPNPPGRSDRAAFDPTLLTVVWKQPKAVSPRPGHQVEV